MHKRHLNKIVKNFAKYNVSKKDQSKFKKFQKCKIKKLGPQKCDLIEKHFASFKRKKERKCRNKKLK